MTKWNLPTNHELFAFIRTSVHRYRARYRAHRDQLCTRSATTSSAALGYTDPRSLRSNYRCAVSVPDSLLGIQPRRELSDMVVGACHGCSCCTDVSQRPGVASDAA